MSKITYMITKIGAHQGGLVNLWSKREGDWVEWYFESPVYFPCELSEGRPIKRHEAYLITGEEFLDEFELDPKYFRVEKLDSTQ